MKGGSKVVVEQHRHAGVFIARGKEDALVTRNMVPGESVYGEKRISVEQVWHCWLPGHACWPAHACTLCQGDWASAFLQQFINACASACMHACMHGSCASSPRSRRLTCVRCRESDPGLTAPTSD